MIDLHSHILPGLDDGSQSMEESLKMARIAEREGIEKMVATPHLFRGDYIREDLKIIGKKRNELNLVLKKNNIQVEIFPGAEVHIFHNLIDEIKKNRKLLVLNQSSYMFIEFPADHVFSGVKNLFFELMNEGIKLIIAHPERNSVFIQHPSLLYELIQMGGLSQVNCGSFSGAYGRRATEAVYYFLELNLIHFIASDCHNSHSRAFRFSEAVKKAENIVGGEEACALVKENPQAVLEDKKIPYLNEPIDPNEKEKSFKIKIPNIFRQKK